MPPSTKRPRAKLRLVDAYRALFLHPKSSELLPHAELVLADLRDACSVDGTTIMRDGEGRIDPLAMAMNEGARMIWLRMVQPLHLSDETVRRLQTAAQQEPDD